MREDPTCGPDIRGPLEVLGVQVLGDSGVTNCARFKTKPIKQWGIGREFNRRIKKRFDELGIEIPFPHVTLYAGRPKKGEAPPLPVSLYDNQRGDSPV